MSAISRLKQQIYDKEERWKLLQEDISLWEQDSEDAPDRVRKKQLDQKIEVNRIRSVPARNLTLLYVP